MVIDIKVHFVKEEDQKENHQAETGFQKMNKLSTGQKTVIALALIFALQCCDPVYMRKKLEINNYIFFLKRLHFMFSMK